MLSLTSRSSQLDSLTSKIHDDGCRASTSTLPAKIVALSALIDAFPFPDSPFSSATLAVDDPDRPEGPSRKRRRLESGGDEGWDTPGRVEGARAARLAFELVETELEDLAALAQAVKLSLALRRTPVDQNKAHALEDTISEFSRAADSAHAMLESELKYHTARAALASALLQSPSVQDYALSIAALDRKAIRTCRQHLTDTRDVYLFLLNSLSGLDGK